MPVRLLLVIVVLLAGACGDPATVSTDEAGESDSGAAAGAAATVALGSSDLGSILTDGDGNTLYLLTSDEQGESTCYDDCESNWPVLEGPAEAGEGADAALLGETEREDGTIQTTYNDWPLYYFAGDEQAGDVNGQGVGDVWYVLDAAGEPVEDGGSDERPRDY